MGPGEQYLASDPELFTEAICTGARPWLTLDAPEEALSERLESWSCFPMEGHLFVVRMFPVRVGFDPRPTYFTHARAFPLSDALGPFDPGAYIGVPAAFDAPWSPEARPAPTPLPPLETPRPPAADWDAATRLLGHLYQAFVQGFPVVVVAGPSDCRVGGRLFSLVAYARAALPWSIKREYRARLFTREPRLFLRQLDAHLLVVPQSVAADALETRRDALLLDGRANVVRGPPLSAEARAYAETLQTLVERLPHGLLPFAARAAEHLPARALPAARDLLIAQSVYNLSVAGPGQMDSLFRFLLTVVCAQADSPLPFEQILRPGELRLVSDARLAESLLHGSGGETISPSADALLRLAAADARRRRLLVDDQVRAFGDPPTEIQLRKMGWLAREKVLSPSGMAQKTVTLPLSRVADLLPPAEALGHERDVGVLGAREEAFQDLASWAGRDPAVRDLLLDATAAGALSERWLLLCCERAQGEGLASLAGAMLEREQASPKIAALLTGLLPRLSAVPADALRALRPSLERAAARTDPVAAAPRYVEIACLLSGSGGLPPTTAQTWTAALGRLRDPGLRQWIVERAAGIAGVWHDETGALLAPATWDRDIASLALGRVDLGARLSFPAIARLARGVSDADPGFQTFMSAADREAMRDLDRAAAVLVHEGVWLAWRRATRVSIEHRRLAHAWLGAPHSGRRDPPLFDEWEMFLADLSPHLEPGDVEALVPKDASGLRRARWPWVAPYEEEQVQSLARLALSLDQVAALARGVTRAGSDQLRRALQEVLLASPLRDSATPEALEWLLRRAKDVPERGPIEATQLPALLSVAGSLRASVVNLKCPMPDDFVEPVAIWLSEQPSLAGLEADFLQRLASWVQDRGRLPELAGVRPRPDLAEQLRRTHPSLAPLVDPPRGKGLYDAVLTALRAGEDRSAVFQDLADEIAKWTQGRLESRGAHPLQRLAAAVRGSPFADAALHSAEEATFLKACSWNPTLYQSTATDSGPLPALELLFAITPTEEELPPVDGERGAPGSPGAVACRFIAHAIADRGLHGPLARESFWRGLLASLVLPERRTGVVPHRPAAAVAELARLRRELAPWRRPFDSALQEWLAQRAPRGKGFSVPSFPSVPSTGDRS